MPAAFAFSAIAAPTACAASTFVFELSPPRKRFLAASRRRRACGPSRRRRSRRRCGAACGARQQARALGRARDLLAQAAVTLARAAIATLAHYFFPAFPALPSFLRTTLAFVANAFAFVRLGRAQPADLGGDLADGLLVDAVDVHLGRALDRERDALGALNDDRMRVAELRFSFSPALATR